MEMPNLDDVNAINERLTNALKAADQTATRLLAGENEEILLSQLE
jgi:hypothetical protein